MIMKHELENILNEAVMGQGPLFTATVLKAETFS